MEDRLYEKKKSWQKVEITVIFIYILLFILKLLLS